MNIRQFNETIKAAFTELNEKLKEENVALTVICAGGFVLSHHGLRTTKDVDGFYRSSSAVEKAIAEVGDKLNLNTEEELWLNNSVMNLNPMPSEDICDLLYDFSNVKVFLVPLAYIAGMKLKSGRKKDLLDVADIIKLLKTEDPMGFSEELRKIGFAEIDGSLVLEAFGTAYGMDWLQEYFQEHAEEIIARL